MTRMLDKDALQDMLAASPFQALFDYSMVAVDTSVGSVTMRQAFTSTVERAAGMRQYHGGAIAALIDIAGDFALAALVGGGVPTINLRIDYLRPATDTALTATATVRRAGRTVGVVDIDVIDDNGKLVAIGRGCYGTQVG